MGDAEGDLPRLATFIAGVGDAPPGEELRRRFCFLFMGAGATAAFAAGATARWSPLLLRRWTTNDE